MKNTDLNKFVSTWKSNSTVDAVAAAMEMTPAQVSATATKLRKAGVALPKYTRGSSAADIDVDALNALLA